MRPSDGNSNYRAALGATIALCLHVEARDAARVTAGVRGMNPHMKGLLSLFWRMIAFVPVGILGFAALVVVLGLTVILPMYALAVFIDGRYLLGSITLVVWITWLRYGGRLRRLVLEGFEHGRL